MEADARLLTEARRLERSAMMIGMQRQSEELSSAGVLEILEEAGAINRRQERLHSRLLDFFLNPQDPRHQLGDRFLRLLLSHVHLFREGRPDNRRLAEDDLSGTEVEREFSLSASSRSDFVLSNERLKFAVFIEIKVGHFERSLQLKDYWEETAKKFPGYSIGGLFVTPTGARPTSAKPYDVVPLSYRSVAKCLDAATRALPIKTRAATAALVSQYTGAIRRWYVKDPQLNDLAWRIYRKFPRALEELPKFSPSAQLRKKVLELTEIEPQLKVTWQEIDEDSDYIEVQFVPEPWDESKRLRRARTTERSADGRLAVLWVGCWLQHEQPVWRSLLVGLAVAEGAKPLDAKAVLSAARREGLRSSAGTSVTNKQAPTGWTDVWMKRIASAREIETMSRVQLFKTIDERWKRFLSEEFCKIDNFMRKLSA